MGKLINDQDFSDVEDITETLEITVFDENRRTKHDFLGKVWSLDGAGVEIKLSLQVVIPLLKIEHGQKKWYKLKEKNIKKDARGNNPEIQLELKIFWNQ